MRLEAFVRLITAAGTVLLAAPVLAQTADLAVTISATGSLPVGAAKTYTVTATNLGPNYIDQFTLNVTFTPPPGTYSAPITICQTIPSSGCSSLGAVTGCVPVTKGTPFPCVVKTAPMAVGAKVTLTIPATVPMPSPQPTLAADCPVTGAPPTGTNVSATVNADANSIFQLGAPVTDPNTANNTATISNALRKFADLTVSPVTAPTIASEGQSITYSQFITNFGPCDGTAAFADFTPPASLTFVSATGCNNNATFVAGTADASSAGSPGCSLGTVPIGATTSPYTVTYSVNAFPKEITGAAIPVSTDVVAGVAVQNITGHNSIASATTAVDLSKGHGGCSTGGAGTLLAGLVSLVALRLGRRRSS
jgi:uncharacterized repeat protein (TIGR01451 family)